MYSDNSYKTNEAMLWDTGHTKEWSCTGGIGLGKGTKNLNVVDVVSVRK
jgi:hypothetical protein